MKRPSRKRGKTPPTPQEQAASTPPEPSAPVFAPIAKKQPKRRVRRALGKPVRGLGMLGRLLGAPLRPLGRLHGRPRIVVWGLLAVIVVVGVLQLRGGRDDDKLVRQALERYELASQRKDYQTLCDDLLASSYVRQTASSGLPCEVALRTALEDVSNPTLKVESVEVSGDRAAARVRGSAAGQVPGEAVYTLVREGNAWRILPPRPDSTPTP